MASAATLSLVSKKTFAAWLKSADATARRWCEATGFKAEAGQVALLPDEKGNLAGVAIGIEEKPDLWALAALPETLPPGNYSVKKATDDLILGWHLGTYRFIRYTRNEKKLATLSPAPNKETVAMIEAITLVRDLINTPPNDLGPNELAEAGVKLAKQHGAKATVIEGKALLKANYPAIYAVGKGSDRPPCLLDITWGKPSAKKITLVGKGIVFDTGGLDIKPPAGMLTMKKDMGGAAHVLGLAHLIMSAKLPVRLRVLVPIAENSINGSAFRPSDVIDTRSGQTVEIGNTDAEGRLVLCDALHEAASEKPEMIIDFATLTGAARSALGTDLPALFSNDDRLAESILAAGKALNDPLWRMPLFKPYWKMMKSKVADMNNAGQSPYAGAITAALYLEKFIPEKQPWAHVDLMAWNLSARPGRPEGGEAMALRAVYEVIRKRYGKKR